MLHPETTCFVSAVFQAWREQGISFLVLRNYEQLPAFTTNDIDVLVGRNQFQKAEAVLLAAAAASGYRLHSRAEFATTAFYFHHPDSGAQTHFDLFKGLKWRGFDFLSAEELLAHKVPRGLFDIPHPAHEAAVNLMSSFIFNGQVKEKYRSGITAGFRVAPAVAATLLAVTYGPDHAGFLVERATDGEWAAIESRLGALRQKIILSQTTRQPWNTLRSLYSDAVRLLNRFLWPPGLTVVLCGPDGCGKSTVAPLLIAALHGTFSPLKGRQIHWKPRVFSRGQAGGSPAATDPHGRPARNPLASLAYFIFHWLEFLLGWPLRILPVRFKGGLVLIDRYYYDFFVDQRRYRLRVPPVVIGCGYALLPKPDLVFLLDAPPEVLRQRKQEVTPEETARQRNAYRERVGQLKHGVVLDATQPPEKVAAAMTKAVLDFMTDRAAKRAG